jgi:hypothetical protein
MDNGWAMPTLMPNDQPGLELGAWINRRDVSLFQNPGRWLWPAMSSKLKEKKITAMAERQCKLLGSGRKSLREAM